MGSFDDNNKSMSTKVVKTLAKTAPHLVAEWHPTKNGKLTPDQVVAGSSRKVWWKCDKGPDHEWQAIIRTRTVRKYGCPYCAGRYPSVTNSLANLFPETAAEWHPAKNGKLTPDKVVAGSNRNVWWKCDKGPDHEWEAIIGDRTSIKKSRCPYCTGRKPSITNSLASQFSKIAAEWHPTKNSELTPDKIVSGSHAKVWWKCSKGPDHEWQADLHSRTRAGHGCPYCAGRKPSITNSLASQFSEIATEWHPTKNGKLTPDQVVAGSAKKVWWKCDKGPDHEWQVGLNDRTGVKKPGCPCCAGQKLSITNSLASQFPKIAAEWHPTKNGKLTPDQVVAGSHEKVWWKCDKGPDHEWQASIHARTGKRKYGCSYCDGKMVSVTNSLQTLFPHVAAEWHPSKNEKLTPEQVTAGTRKSVWWKCANNPSHEWKAGILNRTGNKSGCPACAEPGFDQTRPAILYYIRIDTEGRPLYKIGITNRTVEERFPLDLDKITVVATWDYPVGIEALGRETEILRTFKDQLYDGPSVLGTSNAEIFEFDVLDLDR